MCIYLLVCFHDWINNYSDGRSNANGAGLVGTLGRFDRRRRLALATSSAADVQEEQGNNESGRLLNCVGQLSAVARVNEDLNPMVRDDQVEHEIANESQS